MTDRSKSVLKLYKRDGTLLSTSFQGLTQTSIYGLASNQVVAKGDYYVTFTENDIESNPVDVPGFTVLDGSMVAPSIFNDVWGITNKSVIIGATQITAPNVTLGVFSKDDITTPIATGSNSSVTLTGLTPGTSYAKGDFVIAWVNSDTGFISPTTQVTAFTTKASNPTEVTATPTDEGATVKAK